jgi:hypothetical protein
MAIMGVILWVRSPRWRRILAGQERRGEQV